ncbi:MAG TPA: signal peptide peptidase SppA [Myxococcota bacterium]|nr:signal peptide peptidase SppA [Myxococcota bacterium]
MRRWLRLLLVLLAIALVASYFLRERGPRIAQGSVLVIDLSGEYVESAQPPLLARLTGPSRRPFASVLSTLATAERDSRLSAIVLRVRDLQIGWAKAQELRDAIASASSHGRRTIAWLEIASFGANLEYYVASAAKEVYAAPATRAPVVGLAAEYLFFGGLLERLGVEVEVERIGRYKSAVETITGRGMSDSMREVANSLLDSVDSQFVSGIAESRKLGEPAVREAIAAAPVDPAQMQKWGLIDGALQWDELMAKQGDAKEIEGEDYAAVDPAEVGFSPVARFALIYGSGPVVLGKGSLSPSGSQVVASESISQALKDAADDASISAIVLRIDSPGGSALASDVIWRAATRARAKGKPLIASFSDVAASGGYYLAVGADSIVASPATITGSIGVFALRPVLEGVFQKLDIGFDSIVKGPHAEIQLSTRPLSPSSRERMKAEVASIYDLFVERVDEGRSLDRAHVDAVGQGRVWTGAQAREVGLVDELGGLRKAVLVGKKRLSIAEDKDVALVVFPAPRSLAQQIADALTGKEAESFLPAPALLAGVARRAEPWLEALESGVPMAALPFALEIR